MLRILLAEHHTTPRWALKTMIEEEPEIELAGEAADMEGLLNLSEQLHPDLILMERELPGGPIEDVLATLHQQDPKPVVIVMSSNPEFARTTLKAGADAFVSKGDQADWLLHVLQKYIKSNPREKAKPTQEKE